MKRLTALLLVLAACSPQMTADQEASQAKAEEILAGIGNSNEPDTILLAARAHLHLAVVDADHEQPARELLDRLTSMTVHPDVTGWGLSADWDAFGDGSVNPSTTIYAYTTAAAALAFIDGYEILGNREYLETAERAAQTIISDLCCWDDGTHASVWYSDQGVDQHDGMQVHNVSGLSLAVFERLAGHGIDIDRGTTDRLGDYLIDLQGTGWERPADASPHNWAYAVDRHVANDLLHETFIVEGLLWHQSGRQAAERSLAGIVERHFVNGRPVNDQHTLGSHEWGPPAGLYILVGQPGYEETVELVAASFRATDVSGLPERARGWYALALARHAQSTPTP